MILAKPADHGRAVEQVHSTPTWVGIGTVVGGAIGALIAWFIQTGVVAAGNSPHSSGE